MNSIDQLYEIYQRYQGTHTIIIGGDLNEDLNNEKTNKMNKYLLHFIKECGLSYDNSAKTFIKPNGEDCSELDYFLHTINYKLCTKKEVLNNTITNVSDNYPFSIQSCHSCYARLYLYQRSFYKILVKVRNSKKYCT